MDESALQKLIDEAAVRNVIARLGHLADDGDLNEYLTLFTDDAEWGNADDVRRGLDDILAGAKERRASGVQGPGTDSRHINTTLWVDIVTPTEARAGSYFIYVVDATTAPTIKFCGRYEDQFRKTPEGWKMRRRNIVSDVNSAKLSS